MVRLLMCHNFKQQRVFSDAYEPASITSSVSLNVVFVATSDSRVFVYSLAEEGFPQICQFPLVSTAQELLYNNIGNCILTRERTRKDKLNQFTARVYFNWSHWDKTKSRKIRQLHVGFALGRSFSLEPNDLTAVEISSRFSVRALSCCTSNGSIAIATETTVSVYKSSEDCPLDLERIYYVEAGFSIFKLAICEQFIAFASTSELRVLKVTTGGQCKFKENTTSDILNSETHQVLASGIISNSMSQREVFNEQFVVWSFNQNANKASKENVWDEILASQEWNDTTETRSVVTELPSVIGEIPYIDYSEEGYEIFGPTKTVYGHPITFHSGSTLNVHHVTMLYKCFDVDLIKNDGDLMEIHTLQLVPFYTNDCNESSLSFSPQLSGMVCFISTPKQGIVYNVFTKSEKICECLYTSDTTMASIGENILYAVTNQTIETYTVPYYASFAREIRANNPHDYDDKILVATNTAEKVHDLSTINGHENEQDANCHAVTPKMLKQDGAEVLENAQKHVTTTFGFPVYDLDILRKPCPSANKDLFVIGVQSFHGVYFIATTGSRILLLSDDTSTSPSKRHRRKAKSSTTENPFKEWTLHVLEAMDLNTLYNKMECLTEKSDDFNTQADLRLLEEQHLILRWQFHEGNIVSKSTKDLLLSDLKKSIRNIGDYYARYAEEHVEDVLLFYEMANVSVQEIINEHVAEAIEIEKLKDKKFGDGLMCYLNDVFFTNNQEKNSISFPQIIADKIMYIYSNADPSKLSELILRPLITGYCPELVAKLLIKLKKTKSYSFTVEDHLSLAIIYLQLCALEHAAGELLPLPQENLAEVCVKRHYIFYEKDDSMSPLAQLLRQRLPKVFIKTLVSLHLRGIITLTKAIHVLQKKDCEQYKNTHLIDFLELTLNDLKGKTSFREARELLMDIYFAQLSQKVTSQMRDLTRLPHYHVPRGSGHFAKRLAWLDKLPPFNGLVAQPKDCPYLNKTFLCATPSHSNLQLLGASPSRSPKFVETGTRYSCNCCCCWETLLKMQSLLCCRYRDESLGNFVLNILLNYSSQSEPSHISISLLCLPLVGEHEKAVELLVETQPSIMITYAKQYLGDSSDKWRCVLNVLTTKIREEEFLEKKHNIYHDLTKETLSILSQYTSCSVLLSILPDDGNFAFFLPYLIQSCKKTKAKELSKEITAK